MAKKATDPKSETAKRIQRTEAYAEKVRKMFAQAVNEILASINPCLSSMRV